MAASDYLTVSSLLISNNTRSNETNISDAADAMETAFGLLPEPETIKEGRVVYGTDAGSANTYVVTTTITVDAHRDFVEVVFIATNANTGASTLNVDGLGAGPLVFRDGSALTSGAIPKDSIVIATRNGTNWIFRYRDASTNTIAAMNSAINTNTSKANIVADTTLVQNFLPIATSDEHKILQVNSAGSNYDKVKGFKIIGGMDIDDSHYDDEEFDLSNEESTVHGIFVGKGGQKMYMVGLSADLHSYTLSRRGDISSATYDSVTYDFSDEDSIGLSVIFNSDGTSFYIYTSSNKTIYQYDMTTAWDISTASYSGNSLDPTSEDANPLAICMNSSDDKIYVTGNTNRTIYQYDMTTDSDLSTASYASKSLSVLSEATAPVGIAMVENGEKVYVLDSDDETIYQYDLTTADDISTGSYSSKSRDVGPEGGTTPYKIATYGDSNVLYMASTSNNKAFQYYINKAVAL